MLAARVRLSDDFADGQAGGLLLDADQLLRGLCRQAPRLAAVTAGPGTESCKAAVTVLAEPAADCFGGDTGAPGAGDQVDLRGLLGDPGCDVGSHRQRQQVAMMLKRNKATSWGDVGCWFLACL